MYLFIGFINAFLSWEAFGPLGKMAFNVYLIHYPIIRLVMAQYAYPVVVTNMLIVSSFMLHNVLYSTLCTNVFFCFLFRYSQFFSHWLFA